MHVASTFRKPAPAFKLGNELAWGDMNNHVIIDSAPDMIMIAWDAFMDKDQSFAEIVKRFDIDSRMYLPLGYSDLTELKEWIPFRDACLKVYAENDVIHFVSGYVYAKYRGGVFVSHRHFDWSPGSRRSNPRQAVIKHAIKNARLTGGVYVDSRMNFGVPWK